MRRALALALAGAVALAGAAWAQGRAPVRVETVVAPDTLRLGEEVTLTWRMWLPKGSRASFPARPHEDSLHHWTSWEASTRDLKGAYREHRLVARFQTFALGPVAVPGPPVRFLIPGEETRAGTFPVASLLVVPTVPPEGPEPPLRDIHGLVPPPWWATVPWIAIAAGVLALILIVLLVRRLRRRRPAGVPATADAPREAPEVEARRRLAALVARGLPEAGRTYEHGTELADLLRDFVDRRFAAPHPGDTTGERVARLLARGDLAAADVAALRGILEACDLTKFARRPYDAARAHQAETIARDLIERWAEPVAEPAAAEAKRGAA